METSQAIGRVKHHGGVLKGMAKKVISQTQARGETEILTYHITEAISLHSGCWVRPRAAIVIFLKQLFTFGIRQNILRAQCRLVESPSFRYLAKCPAHG